MLSLDPVTRAEYDAAETPAARAAVVMAAITGTVTATVYDGSDVARGSGTMQAPWASIAGSRLVVGELSDFLVTSGGTPDANWYLAFESGTRWMRGSFGLDGDGADFTWSLATFATGQTGRLGTVEVQAQGYEPVDQDYIDEWDVLGYAEASLSPSWSVADGSAQALTFALPTTIEIPQDGSILLSNYVAGGTPPYSNYAVDTGTLPTGVNLNPTTSELSAAADATITTVTGLKFYVKDSAAEVLPVSDDQFAVQDAYTSGPRSGHWDYAADLRWAVTNGDWLDANQVSQGATAYDTQTATAIGANMTFDVAALVQRFLTLGENRGFYLRGVSGDWRVDFAGRLSANPPVLTVVTTDGTFTPACTATAYWAHNAVTGQAGTTTFIVQKNGRSAIVRFDLSGVTGTVISASMVLRVTYRNENTQIGIFEADPPGFLLGGNYDAPGFANGYVLDSGIHAHSSVIATLQDWTWATHQSFFDLYSTDTTKMEFGTELDGTKYIRSKIAAGTQDIPTFYKYFVKAESNFAEPTLILQRDAGNTNGQWVNPSPSLPVHDELFFRYRMYLENDFRSTVDSGKFPGFDGRMGRWEVGKWQNVGGNSSNDSLGIKRPYSTGWAFEGHSVRGSYMRQFIADGNPNAELWPYGVYLYSLDSGYYDGRERFGNAVLKRGEWYSIEWRMKMNTISGAADEYGNQTANYDGVLECWCDGTKVYSRNDIRWRRHPLISVAAVHMQMYHGGTANSPIDMHVRFANFVVATEYIGPVRTV